MSLLLDGTPASQLTSLSPWEIFGATTDDMELIKLQDRVMFFVLGLHLRGCFGESKGQGCCWDTIRVDVLSLFRDYNICADDLFVPPPMVFNMEPEEEALLKIFLEWRDLDMCYQPDWWKVFCSNSLEDVMMIIVARLIVVIGIYHPWNKAESM